MLRNWDQIKREVEGRGADDPFADVPENLPGLLYARKILRRADPEGGRRRRRASAATRTRRGRGDAARASVAELARRLGVDPELAVRAAARRLRERARDSAALASRSAWVRSSTSTPARSSIRGATRRSRSRSPSAPGPRGAPPCPPAPRPASSRRPSCATAASVEPARGSAKAVENVNGDDRQGAGRRPGDRPGRDRRDPARARRDAEQVAARGQRDPRRLARGRARRGRRGRGAALPLHRRALRPLARAGDRAAGADDERDQRRRPRRQRGRPAGVHGRAGRRRRPSPRRCGSGPRSSTR